MRFWTSSRSLASQCPPDRGFTPVASALTSTDAANLLFLKQEEKLARDVYQVLYAKWGHMTFRNKSTRQPTLRYDNTLPASIPAQDGVLTLKSRSHTEVQSNGRASSRQV